MLRDAVPVAYVMDEDGYVGVPVDRVKPKASRRLQRERNLEADPRATLLVENWESADWSQLWWVRAELILEGHPFGCWITCLVAGNLEKGFGLPAVSVRSGRVYGFLWA